MKLLIDLREQQDSEIYLSIENLFKEKMKVIRFEGGSITACIGCWNCWLKTPGLCVMKDQMTELYSDYMNSSTVILLMDTAQGFINHQAKAFFDRSIPHYHPYIELVDGECHHVARYKRYPDLVFYFDPADLINKEEQVIEDYLYRTAYHFKSKAYRIVENDSLQLQQLESRNAKNQEVPFEAIQAMEKLVIYNGSPRRSRSNSTLVLEKVVEVLQDKVELRDLKERKNWEKWEEAFETDKHVMFFTPLYVHAMPSHVMGFIERLKPSSGSISFFVQSGFPESSQSYYLEAYFEQWALRMQRTYLGTAIKGGLEGLQMRPPVAQEKMIEPLVKAIVNLMSEGKFNALDIQNLAKPIRFGKGSVVIFNLLWRSMLDLFWNHQLKANGAYEKRFHRPWQHI